MPEFIPVLIAAVLLMVVLLIAFSGGIEVPSPAISNSRTILLGEDVLVANSVGESPVSFFNATVSNGLFSQESKKVFFTVTNPGDVSEGRLKFDVFETNLYGNLLFFVNGKQVFNQPAEVGSHGFTFKNGIFNADNELEVKSESSGWKIWAPTIYKLKGNLSVSFLGENFETFDFNLTKLEILNVKTARLRVFGTRFGLGELIAKINGVQVFSGFVDVDQLIQADVFKEGLNTLELSSERDSRYDLTSVQVVLFFE